MVKRLKRPKTELVFNAAEREDFLTGFQKRKQARKKKAILEAEKQYKEEIIRMRKTKRAQIEKRIEEVSSVKLAHGIELTNFAEFDEPKNTTMLDLPEHTITITSTEEMDLTKSSDAAYLGRNEDEEEAVEVVELTGTDKGDDEEKFPNKSKPIRVNKNAQRYDNISFSLLSFSF